MIDIPLITIIRGFLAISVRVSGLMLFAPFFGSASISPRTKALLVITLSLLLYPALSPHLATVTISAWPQFVFGELLMGAALGIAMNLVFDAVQMAGQLLSIQMGFSLVNIIDPQTQVDSTVIALFHQTLAMLIFLRMDVHLWILRAIAQSFTLAPPGTVQFCIPHTHELIRAGGQVFTLGLELAAPVFSTTFIIDIVLGLLGKTSPHTPLMLLGTPVKILLGFAVLFAALRYWPSLLERFLSASMQLSTHLFST